jgi:hypothetical protein
MPGAGYYLGHNLARRVLGARNGINAVRAVLSVCEFAPTRPPRSSDPEFPTARMGTLTALLECMERSHLRRISLVWSPREAARETCAGQSIFPFGSRCCVLTARSRALPFLLCVNR